MDAVGDVRFVSDESATVFDGFFNSEGCVVDEADVVDEDYVWVNLAVCIVESESFLKPVIDVVLDDINFVFVYVSILCSK